MSKWKVKLPKEPAIFLTIVTATELWTRRSSIKLWRNGYGNGWKSGKNIRRSIGPAAKALSPDTRLVPAGGILFVFRAPVVLGALLFLR